MRQKTAGSNEQGWSKNRSKQKKFLCKPVKSQNSSSRSADGAVFAHWWSRLGRGLSPLPLASWGLPSAVGMAGRAAVFLGGQYRTLCRRSAQFPRRRAARGQRGLDRASCHCTALGADLGNNSDLRATCDVSGAVAKDLQDLKVVPSPAGAPHPGVAPDGADARGRRRARKPPSEGQARDQAARSGGRRSHFIHARQPPAPHAPRGFKRAARGSMLGHPASQTKGATAATAPGGAYHLPQLEDRRRRVSPSTFPNRPRSRIRTLQARLAAMSDGPLRPLVRLQRRRRSDPQPGHRATSGP